MLFVDTSAWVAVTDGSDQYHPEAEAFYRGALLDYRGFVGSCRPGP
jgi:predicted nucleic acid-binding protein